MSNNTQTTEEQIRCALGIPPIGDPRAQNVVILSQSSHLDWDWLLVFSSLLDNSPPDEANPPYFSPTGSQPVNVIFTNAGNLLCPDGTKNPAYYYSICEMGFLAGFAAKYPQGFEALKEAGTNLHIVGGGITSPDNLLPHGESFIRDYLVGMAFVNANLPGLQLNLSWLPDDFGHDSQLPVLLQAMGLKGVGFGRVPPGSGQNPNPLNGSLSVANQLLKDGVDFIWSAADGSTTFAHWMQDSYSQGDSIDCSGNFNDTICPPDFGAPNCPQQQINCYYDTNKGASPTEYVFVPIGSDFRPPITDLLSYVDGYNQAPLTTGVWAVAATFDHYTALVNGYWQRTGNTPPAPKSFFATPYWTGFYASRPGNKILHQATTRALLGAEVYGKVADMLQASGPSWEPAVNVRNEAISGGWQAVAPSTHHDYITGTAVDAVYTGEQRPLLINAETIAESARRMAAREIASLVEATPKEGETPVAVFNQLSSQRTGLVEVPAPTGVKVASARTSGGTGPVQVTEKGNLLFMGSAPSLGYDSAYLSAASAPPVTDPTMSLSYTASSDGTQFTLTNHYLTVAVSQAALWGIASLQDTGGSEPVEMIVSGQAGNSMQFYLDYGDIYRFGNETNTTFMIDPHGKLTAGAAEMVETGPLRLRLRANLQFNSKGMQGTPVSGNYVLEYTLVAGEPFLRMSITGAAPLTANGLPTGAQPGSGNPYSVMVQFPFADPATGKLVPIDAMPHGTTYHWQSELPVAYWHGPTFMATHDFLLPEANSSYLAAMFHASIPAWAIDPSGALIGCVFRNTPSGGNNLGAIGSDTGTHAHHYAIRMPSGVQDASTGAQLYESLRFQTPLLGEYINVPMDFYPPELSFPATFSLASIKDGNAIITAAKSAEASPSDLVLRIYQPTNAPVEVTVSLGVNTRAPKSTLSALEITALETDISGAQSISVTNNAFTFNAKYALATLLIAAKE